MGKRYKMPFNFNETDLIGTPFTLGQLYEAQHILEYHLNEVGPEWLKYPTGVVGDYWRKGGTEAICFFIGISLQLKTLLKKTSDDTRYLINEKLLNLFKQRKNNQFYEAHIEWSVLDMIALRAISIDIEPLSFGPDCRVCTPFGNYFAEITVCTPKKFILLNNSSKILIDSFVDQANKTLFNSEIFREIQVTKLGISQLISLKYNDVKNILYQVTFNSTGEIKIPVTDRTVHIFWNSVTSLKKKLFYWPDSILSSSHHIKALQPPFISETKKYIPLIAVYTSLEIEQYSNEIIKALYKKFKDKKYQRQSNEPFYLIMHMNIGNQVNPEVILNLIDRRIWPNPTYDWISGIGLYFPSFASEAYKAPPIMFHSNNFNAKHPIPPGCIEYFNNMHN